MKNIQISGESSICNITHQSGSNKNAVQKEYKRCISHAKGLEKIRLLVNLKEVKQTKGKVIEQQNLNKKSLARYTEIISLPINITGVL